MMMKDDDDDDDDEGVDDNDVDDDFSMKHKFRTTWSMGCRQNLAMKTCEGLAVKP